MIWEDGTYLWLLLLVPLLAAGIWWYNRQLHSKREKIFGDELFRRLRRGFWPLGRKIRDFALYAGLAFLVVALAGPKVGTEVREVKRQGVDLLVALDLSSSMNAQDVRPSRLDKAKYELSRLVDRLDGDRVGMVVFTGEAYLQAPMTLDYSAMRLFLSIADTEQMPTTTTDFSAAMATALEAFGTLDEDDGNRETGAARVLLLISDGEDHENDYEDELQDLRDQNVSVYTIGIGTEDGERIPVYDDSGSRIGYKRDGQGSIVTTRLQSATLREIAEEGGGEYYEIRTGGTGIDSFLGRLDELQQGEFASQEYADYKNQYQWLAGIGLAFLFISFIFPKYRNGR